MIRDPERETSGSVPDRPSVESARPPVSIRVATVDARATTTHDPAMNNSKTS
jgi:hypothetical protein